MATFVAVIRAGHFAAAARTLGLPKSTVSQRVARLEASLGVRLIERTTRALRPTHTGMAYYERCAHILIEVEEAHVAIRDLGVSPCGLLRVATSHLLGQSVVAAVAATFAQLHKDVEVEVVATDRRVNLVEEGFDVAVVVSASEPDSTLVSRVLSSGQSWCCAAPSYLSGRGAPQNPTDLAAHDCILREAAGDGVASPVFWTFERGDETQRVEARGRLRLSSIPMAQAAALAGAGIAVIPSYLCAGNMRTGRLVRVLADWDVDRKDIRIIYPSARYLSPRVRLFVDALVAAAGRDGRFTQLISGT